MSCTLFMTTPYIDWTVLAVIQSGLGVEEAGKEEVVCIVTVIIVGLIFLASAAFFTHTKYTIISSKRYRWNGFLS